jgi:hypothetical protein
MPREPPSLGRSARVIIRRALSARGRGSRALLTITSLISSEAPPWSCDHARTLRRCLLACAVTRTVVGDAPPLPMVPGGGAD